MAVTDTVLLALRQLGFYDFLLPWLFTFAVVYGLLVKLAVFGDATKKISVILALVVAFFVTGFGGQALSRFFIQIFGGASIILAGLLVIVLFLGMVGKKPEDLVKGGTLIVLVIVGIVLWLLSTGTAVGAGVGWLLSADIVAFVLVIVVIVLAVWAVVREPEHKPGGGGGKKE